MSSERARALREAGDTFDRAEAAKQAERQASIARTNATLAHPNPVVRGMAARLLAQTDTQSNSRPGGSSSLNASSRGGRVANVASKTGANVMARAVEGKATSPGSPSRFAHLAAAGDAGAAELAAAASVPHIPMSGDMRIAAMRREIAANAGRVPGAKSAADVAHFVASAVAKARGEKAPVMAAAPTPARAEPDFSTPESTAAFVLAAAAKARGDRQTR